MDDLLLVGLAGFVASLVDGALGMGFGPTSSSILLASGLSPAAASTTVNLAKVFTGVVGGISHWRVGNVDRSLVRRLAVPGMVGALIGTTLLVMVDGDTLRPALAVVLLLLGLRILLRFSLPLPLQPDRPIEAVESPETGTDHVVDRASASDTARPEAFDLRGVEVAAGAGGVTNGMVGAWGPVVTPYLLHRGLPPRFAVGSVNTAEVAVAVVASVSLVGSLGGDGLEVGVILAMLAGGMVGAPLAAYVVRYLAPRALGLAVAGLLLVTQVRELAGWLDLSEPRWLAYAAVPVLLGVAALRPHLQDRGPIDTPNPSHQPADHR